MNCGSPENIACHPCSFNDCWRIASGKDSWAFSYSSNAHGWCRLCSKGDAVYGSHGYGTYIKDEGKYDIATYCYVSKDIKLDILEIMILIFSINYSL